MSFSYNGKNIPIVRLKLIYNSWRVYGNNVDLSQRRIKMAKSLLMLMMLWAASGKAQFGECVRFTSKLPKLLVNCFAQSI